MYDFVRLESAKTQNLKRCCFKSVMFLSLIKLNAAYLSIIIVQTSYKFDNAKLFAS